MKIAPVLLTILAVCYPIIVFLGLSVTTVTHVSLLLIAVLITRGIFFLKQKKNGQVFILALCVILLGVSAFSNHPLGLKLYPVMINAALAIIFLQSLLNPPTVIEKLARLKQTDLPEHAVQYTRNVTKVWLLFFIVNGCIAAFTALYADISVWTLYNGLISYIMIGLLFAIEYLVRLRVQRNYD